MSRFKPNPEEVCFYIEINDDQTRIRNTVIAGVGMTEVDYLDALQCYIDDARQNIGKVFESGVDYSEVNH